MPVAKGKAGVRQELAKFKAGTLHSGSPKGPIVRNRKQAIAIALSEAGMSRKQRGGKGGGSSSSQGWKGGHPHQGKS